MGANSTAGNAGQLMSVSGTIGGVSESASYQYDLSGRLRTSIQTSNGTSANRMFAYDRWGNRTTVWNNLFGGTPIQTIALEQAGGAPTNRIASVTEGSTVNYSYDAVGNVTNDGAHSYAYDSQNRLVSVDGGSTGQYGYDHQNRRYKKTIGSTVTHYVWEGGKVWGEYNGSTGALEVNYWYAGARLFKKSGGTTQVFLSDRLSIRLSLSSIGVIAGRQGHLPFGEDFAESGTQEKHHFTTYERDGESNTDYALNRQYHLNTGRFTRPDPFRESCGPTSPQKWNRYSYVIDDPINHVDPSGLDLEDLLWWLRLAWNQTRSGGLAGRYLPLLDTGMEGFEPGGGGQLPGQGYAQAYKLVGPAYDKSGTKVEGWRYTPTCASFLCPRGDRIEKKKVGPFLQCKGATFIIIFPWPMRLCLGGCVGTITAGYCDIKPV